MRFLGLVLICLVVSGCNTQKPGGGQDGNSPDARHINVPKVRINLPEKHIQAPKGKFRSSGKLWGIRAIEWLSNAAIDAAQDASRPAAQSGLRQGDMPRVPFTRVPQPPNAAKNNPPPFVRLMEEKQPKENEPPTSPEEVARSRTMSTLPKPYLSMPNSPLRPSALIPRVVSDAKGRADKEELAMRAKKAFDLLCEKKPEEAKTSATRALELAERSCGQNSFTAAKCHRLLAMIALTIGNTDEAERHFDAVQQIDETLAKQYSGSMSPFAWQALRDRHVKSMQSLSKQEWLRELCAPSTVAELDAVPDAESVFRYYWQDVSDRGSFCGSRGDARGAEKYFRKAVEIPVSENGGPQNFFSALSRHHLAAVLEAQERLEEAEALRVESDEILILAFGRKSEFAASVVAARGTLEVQKEKYPEARRRLQEAISICEDIKLPKCVTVGHSLVFLGLCSFGEDDPAAAETEVAKGAAMLKELVDEKHPQFLFASSIMADLEKWHSEREWQSATGHFSHRGRLIEITDKAVVRIKEKDSGILEVAADRLSQEDQAFILEYVQSGEGEEQDPFVSVPK
jgi:tetratricopeptide (TPR) repeat protein